MKRYICIHGHFYQPPRENPWLEAIEIQDSAHPYHDWNERITAECYATNATSRILDDHCRIVRIVNNYSRISFDFGPTLLGWLEEKAPDVHEGILEADRETQRTFSGHGSALAQAYNHMILPLANSRDKYTQVVWGIKDFERRFGRKPEGMWLPETAVDLETLDILAEFGISFTILAPHQASKVRLNEEKKWKDVNGGSIDPTMPYSLSLPSGKSIALFFYDGPISRAVAFEGLLGHGESLAQRLTDGFSEDPDRSQIVHIATDGESYGHHHRFGDMALAYAIHYLESENLARITNYGEFLEKHPPTHEVQIFENSSWSCIHGIERWQEDCGCNSGGHSGWNQGWRGPLREAFDWLRDTLAPAYEKKAGVLLKDPWKARNDYIRLVLDRSSGNLEKFLGQHASRSLDESEKITVLKLLELQRNAMLMYTSCGWFFDELSGIETVQVIQYAGRSVQLSQELFGDTIEPRFLELLEKAKSNIAEHRDGRHIYEKFVKPAMLDLEKVGAHYAMSSLFEDYADRVGISCYLAEREDYQYAEAGRAKLALGRVKVTSEITSESTKLRFGVLHWGDHNLSGCVRGCEDEESDKEFVRQILDIFARADFPETLRVLERHLGVSGYSLRNLFRDEQRKILEIILQSTLADTEGIYRQIYETNAPLLRFLKDLRAPIPKAISTAAEFVLNVSLRRAFENESPDLESIQNLVRVSHLEGIPIVADSLEMAIRKTIEQMADQFRGDPDQLGVLQKLNASVEMLSSFPFQINLWKVENLFYTLLQNVYPGFRAKADQGDENAKEWVEHFCTLGEKLSVRVD